MLGRTLPPALIGALLQVGELFQALWYLLCIQAHRTTREHVIEQPGGKSHPVVSDLQALLDGIRLKDLHNEEKVWH
jgi:hypothetical protein